MPDIEMHTVFLQNLYAEEHRQWLNRFVFHKDQLNFFSCFSFQLSEIGLVEFEVLLKGGATAERQRILLPTHAIVAILLDESRKNPLGFHQ